MPYRTWVLIACHTLSLACASDPPKSALPDADRDLLDGLRPRLSALATNSISFWKTHGPDATNGGFHRRLDRQGNPGSEADAGRTGGTSGGTDKNLLQQARHLWTFSTWYERREPTAEVRAIADNLYDFLVSHMRDSTDGEFYFAVSEDGATVTDDLKRLYEESFVIYALSTYGRVFGVTAATDHALQCFESIDARARDAADLGYIVDNAEFWGSGNIKQTNTHIHVLEALTALHDATQNADVAGRLGEFMDVLVSEMLQADGHVHQEFTLDWMPIGDGRMSYGHDLETAWLLLEAARTLGRSQEAVLIDAARTMAEKSAAEGYDADNGGYYQWGIPSGPPDDFDKEWWVQMEALASLLTLYRLTGDALHLERLEATLRFIEDHLLDTDYGEFYYITDRAGTTLVGGDAKAGFWKGSYHSIRALVFTDDWIGELLAD